MAEPEDEETQRGAAKRFLARLRTADSQPTLLKAAAAVRRMAPGDSELGDPGGPAGGGPSDHLARAMAETGEARPSVVRELGLTGVQLWQSLSEAQGRGRGESEMTILFTDLVDFSAWALEAGDEAVIDLLARVSEATEDAVEDGGGTVVKRLGDGLMAVFGGEPERAVQAARAAVASVGEVELDGYRPRLRAGLHLGKPRRIRDDYLGVDVNVAARVAEAASAGEVLISGEVLERMGDETSFDVKRKRRFKAKGAPKEMEVFLVRAPA